MVSCNNQADTSTQLESSSATSQTISSQVLTSSEDLEDNSQSVKAESETQNEPSNSSTQESISSTSKVATSSSISASSSKTAQSSTSSTSSSKTSTSISSTVSATCEKVTVQLVVDFRNDEGDIETFKDISVDKGSSVYDVLKLKYNNDLLISNTLGSIYVKKIKYACEFDQGGQSGWVYKVNDSMPSVGCDKYILSSGDKIRWIYTIDNGATEGATNYE